MKTLAELTPDELRERVVHTYVAGGGSRPAVVVVRADDGEAVLKDYNICSGMFAFLIAPLLVARESAALKQLTGLKGVPRFMRRPDRKSILMEHLRGVHKVTRHPAGFTAEYEQRLRDLVDSIHARGVAHCDMRRASNILVDERGEPYLVDFVSSARLRAPWFIETWFFRPLCRSDRNALLKLKARLRPDAMTESERELMTHSLLDRIPRWIGARIRDILRFLLVRND